MKVDLPNYLLSASLNSEHKDAVNIKIRLSGEPESAAETNMISLGEFRDIFLKVIKTRLRDVELIDRDIQELCNGKELTIHLSLTEEAIRGLGLLARRPNLG